MSSITGRLVARFDRWLDRTLGSDDRYICAACDARFHVRSQGMEHVLHCHPEYAGVVVYEGVEQLRPVAARAARTPIAVNLRPAPARATVPALR